MEQWGKRTAEQQNIEYPTAEGIMKGLREATIVSDEALASCRRILTDEHLDYMGDRYRRLAISYWTEAEFHQYLLHPEALEAEADRKRGYVGFHLLDRSRHMVVTTTN